MDDSSRPLLRRGAARLYLSSRGRTQYYLLSGPRPTTRESLLLSSSSPFSVRRTSLGIRDFPSQPNLYIPFSSAAPKAPPMWDLRSVQSKHCVAKLRRSDCRCAQSIPISSNHSSPFGVRRYPLGTFERTQSRCWKAAAISTPSLPAK